MASAFLVFRARKTSVLNKRLMDMVTRTDQWLPRTPWTASAVSPEPFEDNRSPNRCSKEHAD